LKSKGAFLEFLSAAKPSVKIGAVLVVGLLLILLSCVGEEKIAEQVGE
jgi:hypothetical protein